MIEGYQKQMGQQEKGDVNNQHNAKWDMTSMINIVSALYVLMGADYLSVRCSAVKQNIVLQSQTWINGKSKNFSKKQYKSPKGQTNTVSQWHPKIKFSQGYDHVNKREW